MATDTREQAPRDKAVRQLKKRRDFYGHLLLYTLVNAFLVVIWAVTDLHAFFWPVFPIGIWGSIVVLNAWDVFWRPTVTEDDIQHEIKREQEHEQGTAEHEASRKPGSRPRPPLLGLRRKPGRLALAVFRMPLRAYRHDAGWLLGHTFLEFTHIGRKTGRRYETVAMVLRYDPDTREVVICAGWGPDTDWVRNLRAGPAARVRLGRESFTPQHRFLSDEEAFDVAVQFRREHPRRMRLISAILGWGDLRDDAAVRNFIPSHPFVAFRPATTSPA